MIVNFVEEMVIKKVTQLIYYFFVSSFCCCRIQHPGSGMEKKSGSGVNIPDTQHCLHIRVIICTDPDPSNNKLKN
jgi:hypothetical protein